MRRRLLDSFVNIRLGDTLPAKTLRHDSDFESRQRFVETVRVANRLRDAPVLPWVHRVRPRNGLQQPRDIVNTRTDRPDVIQCHLDWKHTRIGDQTVRRLEAVDTAEGSWNSNRAALVTTDGAVTLIHCDQRSGTTRRAATRS